MVLAGKANKVCPVCNVFASANVDALSAHLDQCLGGDQPAAGGPLHGVVAFVEVRSEIGDSSDAVAAQIRALGGETVATLTVKVTHVVFKNGRKSTLDKAARKHVPIVTVTWVERCKVEGRCVDPGAYLTDGTTVTTPGRSPSMAPRDIEESADRVAKCRAKSTKESAFVAGASVASLPDTPMRPAVAPLRSLLSRRSSEAHSSVAPSPVAEDRRSGTPAMTPVHASQPEAPELAKKFSGPPAVLNVFGTPQPHHTVTTQYGRARPSRSPVIAVEPAPASSVVGAYGAAVPALTAAGGVEREESPVLGTPNLFGNDDAPTASGRVGGVPVVSGASQPLPPPDISPADNGEVPAVPKKRSTKGPTTTRNVAAGAAGAAPVRLLTVPPEAIKGADGTSLAAEVEPAPSDRGRSRGKRKAAVLDSVNDPSGNMAPTAKVQRMTTKTEGKMVPKTAVATDSVTAATNGKRVTGEIVLSGLSVREVDTITAVATHLGGFTVAGTVSPRTTHVVSSGVRTLKVLQGIARGCWIVTPEWALESLEAAAWLAPAPFERATAFPGARVARVARETGHVAAPLLLFQGQAFLLGPRTSLPSAELTALIKECGGTVVRNAQAATISINGTRGLDVEVNDKWIFDSISGGHMLPTGDLSHKYT